MNNVQEVLHSPTNKIRALALTFLLAPVASFSAFAEYQLIDLGIDVTPTDINNQGTIVGARKTDTGSIAFRQLPGGQAVDIANTTVANAVNEFDQVTGNTLTGAFMYDNALHRWDGVSGYGINETGQISGNKQLKNPYRATPLPVDPAIYTPNKWDNLGIASVYPRGTRQGVYADLYVLNDINDSGYSVGSRRRYGLAGSSPILVTPAFDGVTYLTFPYGGSAAAINNQNKVVGTSGSNSTAGQYAHAQVYDYNTDTLFDLGTLNGGLTSGAADINEQNQVVGTSWLVTQLTSLYDPTQYHGFLWENDQMTDLNTLIATNSGWILTSASAINDNGDIIGNGLLNGQVHGFLLTTNQTPPPPTSNEPPIAIASSDVSAGRVTLTVNFNSAGSYDPDGNIVNYAWDFGDGSAVIHQANISHAYTERGTYIAMLTVIDNQGLSASSQVTITARKSKGRK